MAMKRPLMKGLVGQSNPKKNSNIKRVPVYKEPLDTSIEGVYKIEPINYDVPLSVRTGMNSNIKAKIKRDEVMESLGFKDLDHYWIYKKKISHIDSMEEYLIVSIRKEDSDIHIDVFDEFLNRTYDYQQQLQDDEFNEYANAIHINVQDALEPMIKEGVINGYNRGDYI